MVGAISCTSSTDNVRADTDGVQINGGNRVTFARQVCFKGVKV